MSHQCSCTGTHPVVLRQLAQHSYYVSTLTASCVYVGTLLGCTLHSIILSTTTCYDAGPTILLSVLGAVYSWHKDNHYEEHSGVLTSNSSVGLLAAVLLLVISEVLLFICLL